MYRQQVWDEPLIYELKGERVPQPSMFKPPSPEYVKISEKLRRRSEIGIPDLPEVEVARHYYRLSRMNFSVEHGPYPLGSCTMKYTPKILERLARIDGARWIHPLQPEETVQGALKLLYELSQYLSLITGMDKFTLQPAAGAQGELVGALIIRAYHVDRGEGEKRVEMIVPDSAHGTNPASARMAGFKVVTVPSGPDGTVDLKALESVLSERTAGLMITNPNTLGLFESNILEIAEMIHDVGGLMYYDGANLNGILGIVRPGDMGFDIVHLNLHKTFASPHGGGGPGAGPVGVKSFLSDYLPVPTVEYKDGRYYLNYDLPKSIGRVKASPGNFLVLLKALAYIMLMGGEGLRKVALKSVKNTNLLVRLLKGAPGLTLPYNPEKPRKHEVAVSLEKLREETGVRALHVAKRLLDYGVHAPTMYFPLIVEEALLIELPETETRERVAQYAEIMKKVLEEAYDNPDVLLSAPHNTSIGRLDEGAASKPKTMALTWRMYVEKRKAGLINY